MGQTPADQRAGSLPDGDVPGDGDLPQTSATDPLARLEDIGDIPLADQVAVFDAIHAHLSARLTSAEN
jgi:hypothetical protein